MFAESEAPAAQSARQGAFLKRTAKRVAVPGAMVGCARKTLLGTWKPIGVPFNVCDLAMNGISFRNFGEGFDPGTTLRLNILVPGRTPITVTGEVVWNRAIPHMKEEGPGVRAHVCGVQFKKYCENAWAVLTVVIEEPAEKKAKKAKGTKDSKDPVETSPPDLSILA
jgi:hypothetical protein